MLKLDDAAGGIIVEQAIAAAYTRAEVRQLDRLAIESGIPGLSLMQRAGAAAFAVLHDRYPDCRSVLVVCGAGNNAGDGYVVATLARQAGLQVKVCALTAVQSLRGDAALAAQAWCEQGEVSDTLTDTDIAAADVIVDAILGTGLQRDVEGDYLNAIRQLNQAAVLVLALDVPSGLDADTGKVLGAAVQARQTVTFIGVKQGLLTGAGPDQTGELIFADLAVPTSIYESVKPSLQLLTDTLRNDCLPPRPRGSHKGRHGHVLIIGGDYGYLGAVCLAAQAAARTGAGLVTVASRESHTQSLALQAPEIMSLAVEGSDDLSPTLERVSCIVIGPGLGQSAWAATLLGRVLQCRQPLVVDADALNLLAGEPARAADWILTPHPGEAARLLACDIDAIQADRFAAVTNLQQQYGGVAVLKGAGTLIKGRTDDLTLCCAGNPGMGTGGMGDVLSGIIAGLLAQGLPPEQAAALGVYIHAVAADRVAEEGERGLLAGDLLPHIRRLVNP
ncbi:MAG: NAD(P)H-hydrate dehydratase [Gammaproteobacteria bacterium]